MKDRLYHLTSVERVNFLKSLAEKYHLNISIPNESVINKYYIISPTSKDFHIVVYNEYSSYATVATEYKLLVEYDVITPITLLNTDKLDEIENYIKKFIKFEKQLPSLKKLNEIENDFADC